MSKQKEQPKLVKKSDFIEKVKQEILKGEYNYDRIRAAYQAIIGNDYPANMNVMRLAILNHGTNYLD